MITATLVAAWILAALVLLAPSRPVTTARTFAAIVVIVLIFAAGVGGWL